MSTNTRTSTLNIRPALFAPVAPIQILEAMTPGQLGNYHLFLAHHTVEHPERFRALCKRYTECDLRSYRSMRIIMDNSIVELGGAVDDLMIRDATRAITLPDTKVVPCLPDVMGNAQETIALSEDAYFRWENLGMDEISHCGYMLVAQAANKQELIDLCNHFFVTGRDKYRNISWVGIPRYMLKQDWASRKWAIRYIQMVAPWVRIHLLGFSDDILTDMFDARELGVQGIDSAVPVRYDKPLLTTTYVPSRDPKWMEDGHLTQNGIQNIARVRQWCDYSQALHNSI